MAEQAGPRRVLIVDDELNWRERFRDTFLTMGLEAETASGTADARELLRRRRFDLLVLDLFLSEAQPPLDYQRFLHYLREQHPGLPVIVATGYSLDLLEAFALPELGVAKLVHKPRIQFNELKQLVVDLLERGDRLAEPPARRPEDPATRGAADEAERGPRPD
jgi:DNA-binding NtrC family response regulator